MAKAQINPERVDSAVLADAFTQSRVAQLEKVLHINATQFVEIRTFYNVSTEPIDSQVFTLPDYCSTKPGILNQCGGEWCALLRTQKP